MNPIRFRTAALADSQRIASLHIESWQDAYRGILPDEYLDGPIEKERTNFWRSRLSSDGAERRYVVLAETEDTPIAFVCVLLDREPSWGACLDNLHVLPEFKGNGIGRGLLRKAVEWVISVEPGWPMGR